MDNPVVDTEEELVPLQVSPEMTKELEAVQQSAEVSPFAVPSVPHNDFFQIASGAGAAVEPQSAWEGEGGILNNGFPTGIVLQQQYNKAWRQATSWIRALGWHSSQLITQPSVDDGNSEKLWRQLFESLLVTDIFVDPTGVNNYVSVNSYNLSWTAPVKNGTHLFLWIGFVNTSTNCTFNFMGAGSYPIKHLDGSNPQVGDIKGVIRLLWSDSNTTWYIASINYHMLANRMPIYVDTNNLTFYISPTGTDDLAVGRGLTPELPWLTLQYAYDFICHRYEFSQFVGGNPANPTIVTIQMADGTYNRGLIAYASPNNQQITINGNISTPSNVLVSVNDGTHAFWAGRSGSILVRNLRIRAGTPGSVIGVGIYASFAGYIDINNVIFDQCGTAHINSTAGGFVVVRGAYTIAGPAPHHYAANSNGLISCSPGTSSVAVTLTGSPTFVLAFAQASVGGTILAAQVNFTGSGAIGRRFIVNSGGVIDVENLGINVFPGNLPGIFGAAEMTGTWIDYPTYF